MNTSSSTLRSAAADWAAARAAIIARVSCAAVCELAGMHSAHNRWPCPNPAHKGQERGPDLTMNREDTGWRCHACNAGGSVFDLAVHLGAARDISDAIRVLAALAGVELPQQDWRQNQQRQKASGSEADLERAAAAIPSERACEIRRRFATVMQSHFAAECSGAEWLRDRGIEFVAARSAGCGWIADPDAADAALRGKYSAAELRAAGLISRTGKFLGRRHRLIIADRQTTGDVIAFRSIASDAKPKEIAAGRGVFGVGSEAARERLALHTLTLWCEGTTDWLTALALGFAAVGIPGAGQWRYAVEAIRQMRQVAPSLFAGSDPSHLFPQRHVIFFDADEAGRRGAAEFAAALTAELPASHAIRNAMPSGDSVKDLNDCVRLGADRDALQRMFDQLFSTQAMNP